MIKRIGMFMVLLWALGLAVPSAVGQDVTSGLIIYYSFDNFNEETVTDQSGNNHDGAIEGDITPEPLGKRNGAAKFEGTGGLAGHSYLDLDGASFPAGHIPTSGMTIAAWVKCENTGSHHALFNARATDGTWLIHPELRSNGIFRWLLRSPGQTTIFDIRAGSVTWDEWLHFAGTYDKAAGKAFLYINGELVAEEDISSPASIAGDWGQGARVGYNIDDARPFTGIMDEFYIFKRALSENDIAALMAPKPVGTVEETGGSTIVYEKNNPPTAPGQDSFTVVLDSQPTADVAVSVDPNSDDYKISGTPGPNSSITLTFTSANWDQPQTVTVEAIDDSQIEPTEISPLIFNLTSDDPCFAGGYIPSVLVTIIDDDGAGIVVDPGDGVEVSEAGLTDTYSVALSGPPTQSVTIFPADNADPNRVEITPESLTFTTADYATPQNFTVTAFDNEVVEADPLTTIVGHIVVSGDLSYNGMEIDNVVVSILENDCGAWGFDPMDFNQDCEVNLLDFAVFIGGYLECSIPYQPGCERFN